MKRWPDNQPDAWYYLAVQEATNGHEFERRGEIHEHWTKLTTPVKPEMLKAEHTDGAERPPRTWGPSVICRTDVVQERKEPLPFIQRGSRG